MFGRGCGQGNKSHTSNSHLAIRKNHLLTTRYCIAEACAKWVSISSLIPGSGLHDITSQISILSGSPNLRQSSQISAFNSESRWCIFQSSSNSCLSLEPDTFSCKSLYFL